jgi:hypothetical protein
MLVGLHAYGEPLKPLERSLLVKAIAQSPNIVL